MSPKPLFGPMSAISKHWVLPFSETKQSNTRTIPKSNKRTSVSNILHEVKCFLSCMMSLSHSCNLTGIGYIKSRQFTATLHLDVEKPSPISRVVQLHCFSVLLSQFWELRRRLHEGGLECAHNAVSAITPVVANTVTIRSALIVVSGYIPFTVVSLSTDENVAQVALLIVYS